MPPWGLLAAALLGAALAAAGGPAAGRGDNPYVDARDEEVAQLASKIVIEQCSGGWNVDINPTDAREKLLDILGGDNVVLNILKAAKSPTDSVNQIQRHVQVDWLLEQAAPMVMAAAVVVLYFCWCVYSVCCWSPQPQGDSGVMRTLVLMALVACLLGVLYTLSQAQQGYDECRAGFDATACKAAALLNTTLQGEDESLFIGVMPILRTLYRLDQQLEDNSPFLSDLDVILARTAAIEDSLLLATGTLKLLGDALRNPANVRPSSPVHGDLLHVCRFCEEAAPVVQKVSDLLTSGVASALSSARAEVAVQLSHEKRRDMQQVLRAATAPTIEVKRRVRDSISKFLGSGDFSSLRHHVHFTGVYVVNAFFVFAAILSAMAYCAASSWSIQQDCGVGACGCGRPYRTACCSWACSFLFLVLAFVIGGAINTVTVPLAGACLMMSDINGQMVEDIKAGVGLNVSADVATMIENVVDQCVHPHGVNVSTNLLDALFMRNQTTREKISLRSKIVVDVRDPIEARFAALRVLIGHGMNLSIAKSAPARAVRQLAKDIPVSAMLLPDGQKLGSDPLLSKLALNPGLAVGFATSCHCDNQTVPGGLAADLPAVVPGISNFVGILEAFGSANPGTGCLHNVSCSQPLGTQPGAACAAGNALVQLKQLVMQSPDLFRCDLFRAADGSVCDPAAMVKDGDAWKSDCLQAQGSTRVLEVLERSCNLDGFTSYVQAFDSRIQAVLSRLDASVVQVQQGIVSDLGSLVAADFVGVVDRLVDGMRCGFLPNLYGELLGAFCYQGVNGLAIIGQTYVVCAAIMTVVALLMYFTSSRIASTLGREAKDGVQTKQEEAPLLHVCV